MARANSSSRSSLEMSSLLSYDNASETCLTDEDWESTSRRDAMYHIADREADHFSDRDHFKIRRLLYTSHFLSTWNSRVFEFGAFLFLAHIYPQNLLPASIYALARNASAALFATWLGKFIDRGNRLTVVQNSIVGQRVAVALSCAGLFLMVQIEWLRQDALYSQAFLAILAGFACVEKLSSVLNTISVERDWVVTVAAGSEERLRSINPKHRTNFSHSHIVVLNSQMRRIDLFCKLMGPLAIALVDGISARIAIVVTGGMTVLSVLFEYFTIAHVYHQVPDLQVPKSTQPPTATASSTSFKLWKQVTHAFSGTALYLRHSAFLPSFSLALLYLTVLSFAGQMITYLLALGLSPSLIGGLRGISALFELSATWLGPKVMSHIGPIRAGIWFINLEVFCVAVACLFFWLETAPTIAAVGAVSAVIASRIGLWGFDLSVQLIVQEEVEPALRGTFSSQEFALQNVFEMLAFASTIIFPRPAQFRFPATISACAVGLAGVLYAFFVRARRGHLVHLSSCMDPLNQKDHGHWWMLGVREEREEDDSRNVQRSRYERIDAS